MRNRLFTRLTLALLVVILGLTVAVISLPLGQIFNLNSEAKNLRAPDEIIPWTAVGSTGAVDEKSLGVFEFEEAGVGFLPSIRDNELQIRYNVTDTNSPYAVPGWTVLEMGANIPSGSVAVAYLHRVNVCTGKDTIICKAVKDKPDEECARCTFDPGQIHFKEFLYYVEVVIQRKDPSIFPRVFTLRLL